MHKLKNLAFFLLAIAFISACDKDEDYDHAKAVLAFENIDNLSVDKSLEKVEITIPEQKNNSKFLYSTAILNQTNENLAFKPKNSKEFLDDDSNIWSDYRFSTADDRYVFEPIINDDKIYVLDPKGILSAYDLKLEKTIFSKKLFTKKLFEQFKNPRIGYFNEQIFAVLGNNEIVAASAVDGKIIWKKTILSLAISAPVSDGKLVYVTTNDNKTYALDINDGNLVWMSLGVNKPTAILGASSPVLYRNILIVGYSSGEIYALNKENGEPIWTQDLNLSKATNSDFYLNDIDATPTVKDDVVYSIGNGGLMMAIDVKTGKYLWKKEIASIADFWIAGEFLYVVNNDDKLIALRRKDGAVKWVTQLANYKNKKKPATKILYKGVTMIGDKLVITDARGKLVVVDPKTGKIEQIYKVGQEINHPAVAVDGKIYLHTVGSYTTNLVEVR